jgi:hypothetical protein
MALNEDDEARRGEVALRCRRSDPKTHSIRRAPDALTAAANAPPARARARRPPRRADADAAGVAAAAVVVRAVAVARARHRGRPAQRTDVLPQRRDGGDDVDATEGRAAAAAGRAAGRAGGRAGAPADRDPGHGVDRGGAGQRTELLSSSAERGGAFFTLVPIRPRPRGERRSLRTSPGAPLRPPLAFNPRPQRLSTPTDAFQLHPDVRFERWNRSRGRRRPRLSPRAPPPAPRRPRRPATRAPRRRSRRRCRRG